MGKVVSAQASMSPLVKRLLAEGHKPERDGDDAMVIGGHRFVRREAPLDANWMRVGPNTDAAIWRPWGRETGEL